MAVLLILDITFFWEGGGRGIQLDVFHQVVPTSEMPTPEISYSEGMLVAPVVASRQAREFLISFGCEGFSFRYSKLSAGFTVMLSSASACSSIDNARRGNLDHSRSFCLTVGFQGLDGHKYTLEPELSMEAALEVARREMCETGGHSAETLRPRSAEHPQWREHHKFVMTAFKSLQGHHGLFAQVALRTPAVHATVPYRIRRALGHHRHPSRPESGPAGLPGFVVELRLKLVSCLVFAFEGSAAIGPLSCPTACPEPHLASLDVRA